MKQVLHLGAVHKLRHAWLGVGGKSKKTFERDAVANSKNWAWRDPKTHWKQANSNKKQRDAPKLEEKWAWRRGGG